MSFGAALDKLEHQLGGAVGEALQLALEVERPGGSSPAWGALLGRLEVTATPEEDRLRAAAASGQLFGASPDELFAALTRVAEDGEQALQAIPLPDDGTEERHWRRLQGLLGRLREETVAAFRKRVMPKRGMFAQALEAARPGQAAPARRETFVMRCRGCGAPRLRESDFDCAYCGRSFGADSARCRACGALRSDADASACPHCGSPFGEAGAGTPR